MSAIWLLITHCSCLFPIGCLIWSYKVRKEKESLFLISRFLYTLFFSLMYHSYHVENDGFINLDKDYQHIWTFLDSQQSSSLIVSTVLYCCRIREPWFYIFSFAMDTFLLILYFFNLYVIIIYLLIIITFITFVFKYKTIIRFLKYFLFTSIFCILFSVVSFYCYFYYSYGNNSEYILYHSLWHVFIFLCAANGIVLRFKLNNHLYPIQNRPTLNSI